MSFLYPLLALAGLGVVVPIYLHLRRRRPDRLVAFSALRFLEDEPAPRRGALRLRDPWLLALRALALAAIVVAFTWPYVREETAAVATSRVHVIDATLSRRADADGFRRQVDALRRELAAAPASEQNAVVVLRGEPEVLASFGDDPTRAPEALAGLEPSHQRGAYLDALRVAQALLDRSLGTSKELAIYGDYQANQWREHETAPPFLREVETRLVGRAPTSEPPPNVGLGEPSWRRFFVGDATWIDLSFELWHQAVPGARVTVTVFDETLGNEKQTILDQTLDLAGEPPRISLRAQWQAPADRWRVGEVRVEAPGDVLAEDDRAHFTVPPVAEGRVDLLARSPFLEVALSPAVMAGHWRAALLDPAEPAADRPLAELPDVLVLEASYLQADAVRRLMQRALSNDKGVLVFLDRWTPLVEAALRPYGLEPFDVPAAEDEASAEPAPLRWYHRRHPIFEPFEGRDLGDLTEVRFAEHPGLVARDAFPLIFGPRGEPLLYEARVPKGRLLVYAFTVEPRHTDWGVHPSFLPALDLALQYARLATPLETAWTPGSLFTWELPASEEPGGEAGDEPGARTLRRAVLRPALPASGSDDPSGVQAITEPIDGEVENGVLRLRLPDEPGVYRLDDPDVGPGEEPSEESLLAMLAVDPPVEESRLEYESEPTALDAWTLPPSDEPAASAEPVFVGTAADSLATDPRALPRWLLAQRWWWWGLVAAFAFLLVEQLVLQRVLQRAPSNVRPSPRTPGAPP